MLIGISIVTYRYTNDHYDVLVSGAFDAEQQQIAILDEQFGALTSQLQSVAQVIERQLSMRTSLSLSLDNIDAESTTSVIGMPFLLTQVPLFSPNRTVNLKKQSDVNTHYVLKNNDIYVPFMELLQKNPLVKNARLISDMGDQVFQVASTVETNIGSGGTNFSLPIPLLDWLDQNRQRWSGISSISSPYFVPPYVHRGEQANYVFVSLPVTNLKPTYLAIEIDVSNIRLVRDDTNYVVWQRENQRVSFSNIDMSTDYSTNLQSLLATRYVPSDWHGFTLDAPHSESSLNSSNPAFNTPQILENSAAPETNWLVLKSVFKNAPYYILLFKDATNIQAQLEGKRTYYAAQMFILAGFCLFVFIASVYKLFLKPFSLFIGYIEKQNSLYEIEAVDIPKGWEAWFEKVQNSFTDNRKLFDSLISKNKELDEKVQERTKALQIQTMQKDRNLALNRAIINSMPDLIYYKNVDGSFVGCNRAFEKFTGISEARLVTNLIEDIFEPKVASELSKFDFQALKARRLFSAKVWHKSLEASDVYINWLVSPVINVEGELLGTVSLGRDITDQEASFRQVEQARNAAESANVAKTEFIANMSHEIRTPMHAILGMLELLHASDPTPIQQSYLSVADNSSRHMLKVINDILDFSKMNAGKLELNNEASSLKDIVDIAFANSLSSAMRKELFLDINVPIEFPSTIVVDKIRLSQILTNLIHNAVKFTDSGFVKFDAEVLAYSHGEYTVCMSVEDSGRGIPEEKQQSVFDAFTQADASTTRQFGGTGLGLAIVFQLVELLDGEINLDSTVGAGTKISITFTVQGYGVRPILNNQISKWLVVEPDPEKCQFLMNKLKDAKQIVSTTIDASLARYDVLMCRPEILDTLDAVTIENIKSGLVEYQPVVFNIMHFSSDKLTTLPFRPLLSAPFSASDIVRCTTAQDVIEQEDRLDGARILVVEDNFVNQQVMTLMLQGSGAQIEMAENGLVALRKLKERTFDLVLLDIQMPVMDGLTCATKIRESDEFGQIPIIAMTGHSSSEDYERSIKVGVDLHLEKPVEKHKLFTVINTFIGKEHWQIKESEEPLANEELTIVQLETADPLPIINEAELALQFGNSKATMNKLLAIFINSKESELLAFYQQLTGQLKHNFTKDAFATLHNVQGMLANIRAEKAVAITKQLRLSMKSESKADAELVIERWHDAVIELFEYLRPLK